MTRNFGESALELPPKALPTSKRHFAPENRRSREMGRIVQLQIDSIDYDTLQAHFSMPMAEAAKKFGVSLTLFKRICRKNGIQRL